jgi:hypothetical protein
MPTYGAGWQPAGRLSIGRPFPACRSVPYPILLLLAAFMLAACGGPETEGPEALTMRTVKLPGGQQIRVEVEINDADMYKGMKYRDTEESLCPNYGGHETAQFVLELGGGEARRLGLTLGQTLEF